MAEVVLTLTLGRCWDAAMAALDTGTDITDADDNHTVRVRKAPDS